MMRRKNLIFAALCALGACAAKEKAPAPVDMAQAPLPAAVPAAPIPVVSGTVAENTVTATATVQAINQKTRMVTLKGADGKSVTFQVDESVKNLPQVKKGDQVIATYYESLAYEVVRASDLTRGVAVAEDVAVAKPGARPGAIGARAVTITAKIKAIDKKNNTVTLKGPQGNLRTVKVKDPTKLDKVQVGDMVQITYTEAVAIGVEAVPKKK